jgi:hypothetical protein
LLTRLLPVLRRRQTEDNLTEAETALDRQTGTVENMTERVSWPSFGSELVTWPFLIRILDLL